MTPTALALVLGSALTHATWNLLVKRAGPRAGGAAFAWLFTAVSGVLLTPVALWLVASGAVRIDGAGVLFVLGSAVLHTTSFLLLQRGYRAGDLSLVYPLARGTGPLLASAAGVVLLGEPLSPPAVAGALLVAGGAFILTGGGHVLHDHASRAAVGYGVLVGALIGAYTVWDKHLVGRLAVPPLLLEWALSSSMALLVTPLAWRSREAMRETWRGCWPTAVVTAVLSSLSYVLFLTALGAAPVSRVAPAREVGILIAVAMGGGLLGEGDARRRLAAAAAIALGVALLAAS
jgi:drug/metabolite transporter (DMT)-like permease